MVGFGVIPVPLADAEDDARRHHVRGLVGVAPAMAPALDYTQHLDRVLDQGPTNSCVAHWFSTAIYLAGQAQGRPVKRPSRRWAYNIARHMRAPGAPLEDLGSSARLMCLGSERHGIVAEERLPFDPAQIDEPAPFDVDVAGADALFAGYYRADASADQLRKALEARHFPGVAIAVHRNFLDWGAAAGVYDEPVGDFVGYHMLTLVGYRPGSFLVLNSWGTGWGNGGLCWMSDRFLESRYAFDRYVITAAPAGR